MSSLRWVLAMEAEAGWTESGRWHELGERTSRRVSQRHAVEPCKPLSDRRLSRQQYELRWPSALQSPLNTTSLGYLSRSMFDELSEKLEATFARLRGRGVLTEADIKEGLREVRRVLLEADVNFQLTREFLERVEKKAVGVSQLRTVSPGQQLVKIVYDELTAMLGERREGLKLSSVPPTVVMMVGLQGSGKTTTAAKLARKLKAEGRQTRLVAADVYRPAAIDQLETLGTAARRPGLRRSRDAATSCSIAQSRHRSGASARATASSSSTPPAGCRSTTR